MPKFSFLVPVYNKVEFLPQFLDSVLSQTFDDYDVICVDDCSSDGSYELLCEVAKSFSQISVFRNDVNKGLGENRNILLDKTDGEYVIFVDPDDYVEIDLLKEIDKHLEIDNEIDVIRFQNVVEAVSDNKKEKELKKNPYRFCCEPTEVISGQEAFCLWMFGVNKINTMPWTYCIKKDLYNGVRYPNYSVLEDFAITPYLIAQANKVKAIDYLGYHYIQYDSSLTNLGMSVEEEIEIRRKKLIIFKKIIELAKLYISKSKLHEDVKKQYIQDIELRYQDKQTKYYKLLLSQSTEKKSKQLD